MTPDEFILELEKLGDTPEAVRRSLEALGIVDKPTPRGEMRSHSCPIARFAQRLGFIEPAVTTGSFWPNYMRADLVSLPIVIQQYITETDAEIQPNVVYAGDIDA